jgi:hypothetical protein
VTFYELLAGKITISDKKSFLPLDLPPELNEKKFPPSGDEIKGSTAQRKKRTIVTGGTKPMNALKTHEQSETNYSIDMPPKTLDELKSRCPAELTGLDRSEWIRTERQKYGI